MFTSPTPFRGSAVLLIAVVAPADLDACVDVLVRESRGRGYHRAA
jgi:hypothetical protein